MSCPKFKTPLKEERVKKGLSQEKLASMVGVSKETIRKIENGTSIPNVFLAIALAGVLKVSLELLFQKLKDKD
ncbi:helix-turn-helix transcriptional regulator [Bacillus sp. REN16]|uniref:helix-turn-helix transcriptional regulator n=1 Tax=Bacillus sp. REN16 TaxID=2887296 RepID=UPI001E640EF5|nr:helix-turn-helix transcriptional regulator [Bacillus sp. REN16]MCC3359720.1 helix-turn-helix transcriptional regulator [Bacillus sp. REN16]